MQKQLDVDRIAKAVLDAVEAPLAALAKRMDVIEARPVPVDGKDGAGITDSMIDRDGVLVLTLSDGKSLKPGVVVGKDGAKGEQGDPGERGEKGETGEAGPEGQKGEQGEPGADGKDGIDGKDGANGFDGKDGKDGIDGKDGLSFDDLEEELADDGRLIIRHYKRGSEVKSFRHRVPAVIYRGVFKEGTDYECGDQVTWGGNMWTCMVPTNKKPAEDVPAWQLSAKRGREGKGVDEDAVVERIMARVIKEIEKHTKGPK